MPRKANEDAIGLYLECESWAALQNHEEDKGYFSVTNCVGSHASTYKMSKDDAYLKLRARAQAQRASARDAVFNPPPPVTAALKAPKVTSAPQQEKDILDLAATPLAVLNDVSPAPTSASNGSTPPYIAPAQASLNGRWTDILARHEEHCFHPHWNALNNPSTSTVTLPIYMWTQWTHPQYGRMKALIDVVFIDQSIGDCPQPSLPGDMHEFFRWQQNANGTALDNMPPVRVCVFHTFVEFEPRITPLQALVGRFFSSPRVSANLIKHEDDGWDAYHHLGYHNITLKTLVDDCGRRVRNRQEMNKPIEYNSTLRSILPRDMLALLCRDECNEYECFQNSSTRADASRHQIDEYMRTIDEEDEKRGYSDQTQRATNKRQIKAMISANTLAAKMPCRHDIRHDSTEQEEALVVFHEANPDPDHQVSKATAPKTTKKATKRVKRSVDGATYSKKNYNDEFKVKNRLDTPWGRRITFQQLKWEHVATGRCLHPFFFNRFLATVNKFLDSVRLASPPANYGFVPWPNTDFIRSQDDLETLFKFYRIHTTNDDMIGESRQKVSFFQPEGTVFFMVRFTILDSMLIPIPRESDYDYTRELYVPIAENILKGHPREHEIYDAFDLDEVKIWRNEGWTVSKKLKENTAKIRALGQMTFRVKVTGAIVSGKTTQRYERLLMDRDRLLAILELAENGLYGMRESMQEYKRKRDEELELLNPPKPPVHQHEHMDEAEIEEAKRDADRAAAAELLEKRQAESLRVTELLSEQHRRETGYRGKTLSVHGTIAMAADEDARVTFEAM